MRKSVNHWWKGTEFRKWKRYSNSSKNIKLANIFEKKSFNKAIIKNSTVDDLRALSFFNIAQSLRTGGTLEIIVHQPISVLQGVDADELEAKAKLGGFTLWDMAERRRPGLSDKGDKNDND